ncbi:DNA-3-methyladenine glycosylase [Akkermansia muciniphila]|uniref:DNA-3-methyladenine glycosylase n=1 Tax=Akkermansia muciniphila TaxID=239935 RepID=UPI00122F013B|nr:DNA-3-methyladenine glycosylase [Akkermansia muciniphila]KAA3387781.1 DNA-3-methyladenine glycosylase [Akkermansia muciniphila]
MEKRLDRSFFEIDALTLARKLLGCTLVHNGPDGKTAGVIVETEAYRGQVDKAAHSYGKKPGGRTAVQFGPGGYAYIYLIYGIHECFNVVAGAEGEPECVLIRALAPTEGVPLMVGRRHREKVEELCSGPGKLCKAMASRRELYGCDLCGEELYVIEGAVADEEVAATPRIGVGYAEEAALYPWRFIIKESHFLSLPYPKEK